MEKITQDTILEDILKDKENEKILAKYNLPCLSCPMAGFEIGTLKLGEVCEMYNIDFQKMSKELNNK